MEFYKSPESELNSSNNFKLFSVIRKNIVSENTRRKKPLENLKVR